MANIVRVGNEGLASGCLIHGSQSVTLAIMRNRIVKINFLCRMTEGIYCGDGLPQNLRKFNKCSGIIRSPVSQGEL